ncbi:hypothetical protein KUV65_05740 [Maritalea mobilis]|uniref:Ferrochelatase n=1 Tax=[Roseibacterium] beibuensis TaxID=1193142 RepID=A0ABP9L005_9RHOB|nr:MULTISPECIES: hypothetical protein [Alphaproteobacteria]MBY6200855.1 hypothetical protein [Maritalea mobilis]MCS6621903.1 hypothetical protein [Roseibacterium beibuensis]
MKKTIAGALAVIAMAGSVAAQEIQPLDTTASTQAEGLPVLSTIPMGAIVVGGVVILGGIAIGLAADGS